MLYAVRLLFVFLVFIPADPAAFGSPMPPEGAIAYTDVLVHQCSELQPALARQYREASNQLLAPAGEQVVSLRKTTLYHESVQWWQKAFLETKQTFITEECAAFLKTDKKGGEIKRNLRETGSVSDVPSSNVE